MQRSAASNALPEQSWTRSNKLRVTATTRAVLRALDYVSLRGDAMMRKLLYEAAQAMMTRVVKWCWLKAWTMNIAKRHGRKKPNVALPRQLAVVMQ